MATKWIDVPQDEAMVGDWASHYMGLDPREVTKIDHESGVLWLHILIGPAGPYPIENYTFRREVSTNMPPAGEDPYTPYGGALPPGFHRG